MIAIPVPLDLAREIERLLHCVEIEPLIGRDAMRARLVLRSIDPSAFAARPEVAAAKSGAKK